MPISNAYNPEISLSSEITKNGVVRSESSHSLDSKSSENSEKLCSDSTSTSRVDFTYDSLHPIFPHVKDGISFQVRRSSINNLGDFPIDQRAYYSDFYNSNEQLPADKKCMNFYKRNANSNSASESDIFKKLAMRRFSLNPEVLRKRETSKGRRRINRFSLVDNDAFNQGWDDYFQKTVYKQKSVGFEENTSMSSSHFDDSSDSLSSSSSKDSDYEQSLKKSIREYFKNRADRDSTSSLCTSHSSTYATGSFPEEIVEPLDVADESQLLNSPTHGNCGLPLHPSLLNLRSTEAEQTLVNLGFCDPSGIIPARFFPNPTKQENGEASSKASKRETQQKDDEFQNTDETVDDVSKNKKDIEVDRNVEHLLMNKKNGARSCTKTNSVDFEEINRSTVHVLNNNKHMFYKQKSIHDEIEEANRNTPFVTFTHNAEPNKNDCVEPDKAEQNYSELSCEKSTNVEKREKDNSSLLQNSNDNQIDTENTSYSKIPNIVSNQIPILNIFEESQKHFEISSLFDDSEKQSAEHRTKKENDSNEEVHRLFTSSSFLSCTNSPPESPLTVIDLSLHDNKDRIISSSEKYVQKRINSKSPIDLDSDDTINNILSDDQSDEVFTNDSVFHSIQEDFLSFSIETSRYSPTDTNNSGVEEWYSQDDEQCGLDGIRSNPYLTVGPDLITICPNSPTVASGDHSNKEESSPEFYTSSFDMFIKSPQKKRVSQKYQSLDERKNFHSKKFSPLVINGIRFDVSEESQKDLSVKSFKDEEDTTESGIFHCSASSEKKKEKYNNRNDHSIENRDKSCPELISRESEDDWSEIKVSKANIVFKLEPQNSRLNKISSKVMMKRNDHSQERCQRQRPAPMSDKSKYIKDSWTQCNLRKRNSYNFPMQNLSKDFLPKNSRHLSEGLHMESKGRKVLPNNKKETLKSATIKNCRINADLRYLEEDAATLDSSSTVFNPTSPLTNNSNTNKAVLRLHKSSQTRIPSQYSMCKNQLNICAKCLCDMNWPCSQPIPE